LKTTKEKWREMEGREWLIDYVFENDERKMEGNGGKGILLKTL
jgi:hypothetical protein